MRSFARYTLLYEPSISHRSLRRQSRLDELRNSETGCLHPIDRDLQVYWQPDKVVGQFLFIERLHKGVELGQVAVRQVEQEV